MYNQEIVNILKEKFGERDVIIFCQIEAIKNSMIAKDMKEKGVSEYQSIDFEYDAQWWERKYQELKQNLIG
jgi:hypothetical protein